MHFKTGVAAVDKRVLFLLGSSMLTALWSSKKSYKKSGMLWWDDLLTNMICFRWVEKEVKLALTAQARQVWRPKESQAERGRSADIVGIPKHEIQEENIIKSY